jgi:hypothetical protein
MLDPLKEETNLLYYNVFGLAIIRSNKIAVSLNVHKSGKILGRTLEKELKTRLKMVDVPILIPFGAWVVQDETYFTPGRLEGYDAEAFELNKEVISDVIKSALAAIRGAVLK